MVIATSMQTSFSIDCSNAVNRNDSTFTGTMSVLTLYKGQHHTTNRNSSVLLMKFCGKVEDKETFVENKSLTCRPRIKMASCLKEGKCLLKCT